MSRYQVNATLEIGVSQDGRRPIEVNTARHALAGVLVDAVTNLLTSDAALRERLWRAAGGGDDVDGEMTFTVRDVQPL